MARSRPIWQSRPPLDGKNVPYIVRREIGTINRAVYAIAFYTSLARRCRRRGVRRSAWNGRSDLQLRSGLPGGLPPGTQSRRTGGNRSFLEETQFGDYGIAKGYALASSSLNSFGTNCADVISVETMMMVKEHFIEQFGTARVGRFGQRPLGRVDAAAPHRQQLSRVCSTG
jgi:hypothetical protein